MRAPSLRIVGIRLDDRKEATIYAGAYGVDVERSNTSVKEPWKVSVFIDNIYIGTLEALPYFGYVNVLKLSWTDATNETLILVLYDSPLHRKRDFFYNVVARIYSVSPGSTLSLDPMYCVELSLSYPLKIVLDNGTVVTQTAYDPILVSFADTPTTGNSVALSPGDSLTLKDVRARVTVKNPSTYTIYLNYMCVRWL